MSLSDSSLSHLSQKKKIIRQMLKQKRLEQYESYPTLGQDLVDHFLKAYAPFKKGLKVAGYFPLTGEADCLPLLQKLHEDGVQTFLPFMKKNKPMTFATWNYSDPLELYDGKIPVPFGNPEKGDPDIILAPLLGFDSQGNRLGYGGGHYDQAIASLKEAGKSPLIIGLAYSFQEMESIPTEEHDQKLHGILTENGLTVFKI
jgi:5-formyltetrahydrofolate cyclo-ligase